MKHLILLLSLITVCTGLQAQNSIGIGTQSPHSSAVLDVSSTTRGLLAPRMTTAQRNGIVSPANGLLVYDTDVNSFFNYNGSAWVNLAAGGGGNGWSLTGNAGTIAGSNFIGTTDLQPLHIRVNNRRFGLLDLNGNILLGDSAGGNNSGATRSIAIGRGALYQNKFAFEELAIGDSAMAYSQSSFPDDMRNVAIGHYSLMKNKGNLNVAVGNRALFQNETGFDNVALGSSSLRENTIGFRNIALGNYSLMNNNSGNRNIAIGTAALHWSVSRSDNIAIGDSALYNNANGTSQSFHGTLNIGIGTRVLANNSQGYQNIGIGYLVLRNNYSGSSNTGVGAYALTTNNFGSENTAVGRSALYNNTDGNNNTAIGSVAMQANTTGDFNTAIGLGTLSQNTTGSGNTGLGYNAEVSAGNLTNATAIGYNATVNASNKIRLGNSSVTVIEGQVAYTTSDGRFKQNIKDNVPGLDFITSLKPYTYQYKSYDMERFMNQQNPERQAKLKQSDFAEAESMVHMGFIAQEVEKLVKEKGYNLSLVHAPTNPTDNYSIAYGELVVPLVKAVQEQQKQIEELKKLVAELMKK
jgi:hypothetical protein